MPLVVRAGKIEFRDVHLSYDELLPPPSSPTKAADGAAPAGGRTRRASTHVFRGLSFVVEPGQTGVCVCLFVCVCVYVCMCVCVRVRALLGCQRWWR